MSQLTSIADRFIGWRHLFSVAVHLGCSHFFCETHISRFLSEENYSTREFVTMALKWLDREEGSGELPRTRDTVMKAFQKLHLPRYEYMKEICEILME